MAFKAIIASESIAGVVLLLAIVLALYSANSNWSAYYFTILQWPIFQHSLVHWINDGLMSLFFLQVGLEIKRELLIGQLNTTKRRLLPCFAACFGVVVPALIYLGFTYPDSNLMHGWAIPTATDIAFSLGVLSLLGSRVPNALKVLLTAIAIIDDLIAIIVIALFYTAHLSWYYLILAMLLLISLALLNYYKCQLNKLYLVIGVVLWWVVLKSGLHATLAGVLLALFIPLNYSSTDSPQKPSDFFVNSPLIRLEFLLTPWVSFLIIPLFGLVNTGIILTKISWLTLTKPVLLGVTLGLFFGKQIGIFSAIWLSEKMKIASRPIGLSWGHIYGLSLICGIGFTMSLFINLLAFNDFSLQEDIKLGILLGSCCAAIIGTIVLLTQDQHNN